MWERLQAPSTFMSSYFETSCFVPLLSVALWILPSLPSWFPKAHSKAAQLTPTLIWFGFQYCRFWSSWTTHSMGNDHRSRRGSCQSGHSAGWNTRWSVWPCSDSLQALKSSDKMHIRDSLGVNLYKSFCQRLRYYLRKHWCLLVLL